MLNRFGFEACIYASLVENTLMKTCSFPFHKITHYFAKLCSQGLPTQCLYSGLLLLVQANIRHACLLQWGLSRQVLCVCVNTPCPIVQAAGLPRNSPRKDWPLPLLKQILTESIQETPRQLLARELWCGSGSASEWWSFQAGYTSSTAAFSMVLLNPTSLC